MHPTAHTVKIEDDRIILQLHVPQGAGRATYEFEINPNEAQALVEDLESALESF